MVGENVLGFVDALTSFGIIAPRKRSLVVTDKRLLILSASTISTTAASAGFAYIFGVFGRGMANRINKEELEKAAQTVSSGNLDEMLKSDPENMSIDIASIEKVEVSRKNLTILAGGKKFGYSLGNPDARNKKSDVYDIYVQALRKALGDRVIAK